MGGTPSKHDLDLERLKRSMLLRDECMKPTHSMEDQEIDLKAKLASQTKPIAVQDDSCEVIRSQVRDPILVERVAEFQKQNDELAKQFGELNVKILDQKIDSFEDLEKWDAKAAETLTKLASETKPLPMQGRNFGVFGLTSTGKSTIINKLIGQEVAKVGVSETTTHIEMYAGRGYCLYDVPGGIDEMLYFSMEFIAFWKALTGRLIDITTTVKEMAKLVRLIDAIGLTYDIIVNKFDQVPVEERDQFKAKIQDEVNNLGLRGANRIWFVSAENPTQFSDWLSLVQYIAGVAPQSS